MGYEESNPYAQAQVTAFRQQLHKFGWVEGSNIQIDIRYAGADLDRARVVGRELVALGPDVVVANTNLVTTVLQSEVRTIPLLFIGVSDPVGSGFVSDLAHPSGNATGFAIFLPSIGGKWLQLLLEAVPQSERIGLVFHPEPPNIGYLKAAEAAASSMKVKLIGLAVRDTAGVEQALATFAMEPAGSLIVAPNAVTFANINQIVALAARYRLPAIYPFASFAKLGGLISYGPDVAEQFRQGAGYVDKILKGAKPANLPVQYPTKFEMVINLRTAKALDLAIPSSLLARADEVIE